jgi:hypothetical protein
MCGAAVKGNNYLGFCLMVLWLFAAVPAVAGSNWPPIDRASLPELVRLYVPADAEPLLLREVPRTQGNGSDYLLLVEQASPQKESAEKRRTLLILSRDKEDRLRVLESNDRVIPCAKCGGQFDPLAGIEVKDDEFAVRLSGGTGWRWKREYRFQYSTRDHFWRITRVEEEMYHPGDPAGTGSRRVSTVGRQFGVIAFGSFDPESFLGEGFFCAFGDNNVIGEWASDTTLPYSRLSFRRDPASGRRFETQGANGLTTGRWTWNHCRVALFPDGSSKVMQHDWLIRRSNSRRLVLLDIESGRLMEYRRVKP